MIIIFIQNLPMQSIQAPNKSGKIICIPKWWVDKAYLHQSHKPTASDKMLPALEPWTSSP